MHEVSLSKTLMDIIIKKANQLQAKRIKLVHIEIGELTAVEKTALLFSFDIIKIGTIAENAILNFINIRGQAYCDCCQKVIEISSYHEACSFCGDFSLAIISGQELRIKSMEIE